MTIDEHICSGGVAQIPDLRGDRNCYSDDYATLVITQTPAPGQFVGAGQTIINVVTEDQSGNATICTHYMNVTADNPAPTLECPDPITAWLLPGGWEVPDLTKEVDIIGGCTVYDDLVITQSPVAGTKITNSGTHVITITVEDEFGHEVVCGSTTVTLKTPTPAVTNPGTPPDPPVTIPNYIYPHNILAYWTMDLTDNLPIPGPLYQDVSPIITMLLPGRHLTPGAGMDIIGDQSIISSTCHTPSLGPSFGFGSAYHNRSNTAVLSRVDDSGLRLVGTSFTIRFGFKLVSMDQFGPEVNVVWKRATSGLFAGYKFSITRLGGANNWMRFVLTDVVGVNLDTGFVQIPSNIFVLVTGTFNLATGTLRLYVDGAQQATVTSLGFQLSGDSSPFRIGDPSSGSVAEFYVDDVGIWTEAWDADRVMDDYEIIKCL